MLPNHQHGLLPKFIYLTTTIKMVIYLTTEINRLHFVLILLRLLFTRNLQNPKYYVFVFFTFVFDILVVFHEARNIVGSVLEVMASVLSILWMVFLYPYYLKYDMNK